MDRRIAPAAAAVAVVLLVTAVVVAVGSRDGGPDSALPPAAPRSAASSPESPESPDSPESTPADVSPSPGSSDRSAAPDQEAPASAPARPPSSPTTAAAAPAEPAPRRTPGPSAAPRPAPPPPSPSSPAAARAAFSFDAAYGTDEPREVIVQYGDSSSCPHQDVTYDVDESADRVVVTLEADAMAPERACTADYRQMLVPLRLAQPLGDRVVIDGSRGEPVAVDRSCSRPFANPPPPKDCDP